MWLSSKEEMPESVVPMAKPPGALLATFPMSGPTFCIPPPTTPCPGRTDQQEGLVVGRAWIGMRPVENA